MRRGKLVERKSRQHLLSVCMERGLLQSTMLEITKDMIGKTDEEKERIAEELIPRVEAGEFDTVERTDYTIDMR